MSKYLGKGIWTFLCKYKFTILFVIFMLVISIYPYSFKVRFKVGLSMFLVALTLVLIMNILKKTKLRWIFHFALMILIIFNAYVAVVYDSNVSYLVLAPVLETNPAEATSMLRDGVWLIIFLIIFSAFLIYRTDKELRKSKLSIKISLCLILVCFVVVVPMVIRVYKRGVKRYADYPVWAMQMAVNDYAPICYGNIATMYLYMDEKAKIKEFISAEKKMPEGIELADTTNIPRKIFYVIGESVWRKHMSLYGYPVKTTPFLDSIHTQAAQPALHFYDAISPSNLTREAVPFLFTFATPVDRTAIKTEKTLLNLAKVAGYETLWLSSHDIESFWTGYIGYIASGADYTTSIVELSTRLDDLNLIPLVKDKFVKDKQQFFVVHVVGSHYNYIDRYDKIDEEAIAGGYAHSDIVNYDRSLHHTDRVLKEIYEMVKDEESYVIYYMPDHGDILEAKGHGLWKDGTSQFQVPLVVMNKSNHNVDSLVSNYIDTTASLINTSSSVYIISEIMGYKIPSEHIRRAVEDGKSVYFPDGTVRLFSDVAESYKEK